MSDVSTLRMGPQPKPPETYSAVVSGRIDPAISVDVGQPVTPDTVNPGQVLYAEADAEQSAIVTGLAFTAGEATQIGHRIVVQYAGPMSFPESRWDRVTGQTGGLTPGAQYYLSQTAGMLTTTPVGTTWTARVGIALSSNTLLIAIAPPFQTSP